MGKSTPSRQSVWIEPRYLIGSMLPTWTWEKGHGDGKRVDSVRFILIRTQPRELKITSPQGIVVNYEATTVASKGHTHDRMKEFVSR